MNISEKDKKWTEFTKAVSRLPPPVSCFSNGACCPWCGGLNKTVTFDRMNDCIECERSYAFGYPPWHDGRDPVSWVPFPFREFSAVGERADMITNWEPNDRLKAIYFEKAEERIGLSAEENGVQ